MLCWRAGASHLRCGLRALQLLPRSRQAALQELCAQRSGLEVCRERLMHVAEGVPPLLRLPPERPVVALPGSVLLLMPASRMAQAPWLPHARTSEDSMLADERQCSSPQHCGLQPRPAELLLCCAAVPDWAGRSLLRCSQSQIRYRHLGLLLSHKHLAGALHRQPVHLGHQPSPGVGETAVWSPVRATTHQWH